MTDTCDISIVVDPRFSGGTAAAVVQDVMTFHALGASVGIVPITTRFLNLPTDVPNKALLDLADLPNTKFVEAKSVSSEVAFFHQPQAFYFPISERFDIRATRSVLVTHHPPFRGDASLEYDPLVTTRRIRQRFGAQVMWAPVSGLIRQQLRSFAPALRLTRSDWVNAFDPSEWTSQRPAFSDAVPVVGRHGRADMLKWPDRAEDIAAPYAADGWHTRIMGCPADDIIAKGVDTSRWELLGFNEEPVADFLDRLDVFCYFHSDRWVEAFGRTVAEALLMERPCILDPRLKATFGDLASYCRPTDTPALLEKLRQNPEQSRLDARRKRVEICEKYSIASIAGRLDALKSDDGTRARGPDVHSPPLVTMRRVIGLARRQRRAGLG